MNQAYLTDDYRGSGRIQAILDRYRNLTDCLVPTREEIEILLANLGIPVQPFLRRAVWGEVILDRTRAWDAIAPQLFAA